MAAIRARHGKKIADEEAERRANAPVAPDVDRRTQAKVAYIADRKERERLGLGMQDDPTPEQYASILAARSHAVWVLRNRPDDCPF
jgi:hypothetical protein